MIRKRLSLLAAALLVAAPGAYAAGASDAASKTIPGAPAKVASGDNEMHEKAAPHLWRIEAMSGRATPAQITAFGDAQVPLGKAVSIAEKAVGGQAIDVDFRHQREWLVYRMHVLKGATLTPVTIDAMSGEILHLGRAVPVRDFDRRDRAAIAALEGASVPLARAARTAASHAGGKAMAAAVEKVDGAPGYRIAVVKGAKIEKLDVNGANGQIA